MELPPPFRVAWVDADGIGPEIGPIARLALTALLPPDQIEIVDYDFGADHYLRDGTTLPREVMTEWRERFHGIYMGPVGDPRVPGNEHARDLLLGTRFGLDLYINQRPLLVMDPTRSPLKNEVCDGVRFVVFRENVEDCYTGGGNIMYEGTPHEIAQEISTATHRGTYRIVLAAFEYARRHGLTKLCYSTKSNAMPKTGKLWHRVVKEISPLFPEIQVTHEFIDILCAKIVQNPRNFQVIVTSNLFGDIITDIAAIIGGSMGLAASGNIHPDRVSLFQPVHGSAPDIAGQGIANPFAAIMSIGMMLTHFGKPELEQRILQAVGTCVRSGRVTRELGGTLSTQQAGEAVLDLLAA